MPHYLPAEEARLLQYNNASSDVLVDVDVDMFVMVLLTNISKWNGCGDFGSGGCQTLFNKISVLLTIEEWKTLMGLESYLANQFFHDSIEIQHILEQSFKDELFVRNISRTCDINTDVKIYYNWEHTEGLSSSMARTMSAKPAAKPAARNREDFLKTITLYRDYQTCTFNRYEMENIFSLKPIIELRLEVMQSHKLKEFYNNLTFDTMWKPRQISSKTLTFEMIKEKKILKIEDMSGNEVSLGWEFVSEVGSLESVLRYRLSYSSGSNFKYFYEDVIRAVAEMSGDRLSEKSDDVCCMLEVLLFIPEKALFDVQLERRIQEQGQKRVKKNLLKKMWMLYAQEHWTKSYDLKSAVERLYEELGALEFDAYHGAIYGMERYYTVQQCEELRDKYKIGRKVC
ncbi:hypothetical protein FQA39_LY15988 [Lamprigera yunnana]|nr:hypothetical protein FQA39_LY15988 [Lamprigera yunnana]